MMNKLIILLVLLMNSFSLLNSKVNTRTLKDCKTVTATYYNAVRSQCGSNPLITADGSKINKSKLKSGEIRWIAVSRDLRSKYKYGSKVYVYSNNKKLRGVWEVHDTMNKKFRNKIDFLFHESHEAPMKKPEKVMIKLI